jgi:hypothetical protein
MNSEFSSIKYYFVKVYCVIVSNNVRFSDADNFLIHDYTRINRRHQRRRWFPTEEIKAGMLID